MLLKGKFLLNFNVLMDGMPFMTCIKHKGYVTSFLTYLLKNNAEKISYNKNEAIDALRSKPAFMERLMRDGVDAVFNFLYIGYFIKEEEIADSDCPNDIKKDLLELLLKIISGKTSFYISFDTLRSFCNTGNIIVPLIGTVNMPHDMRISYLKRLDPYINKESSQKIKAVGNVFPKAFVLCAKGLSLVYLTDGDNRFEKNHCLETTTMGKNLANEIENTGPKTIDFSEDLWNSFISEAETLININKS